MRILALAASLIAITPVLAQSPQAEALLTAQREAMRPLAMLDGNWRGTASTMTPQGKHELIQTERTGAFLDGTVRVIEGRGYEPDGRMSFNALAVVSYNPRAKTYSIQSYAMGYSGTSPFRVTDSGFVWETPAGPGATMRYTATIKGDDWQQVGERVTAGAPPLKVFEMKLKRVGKSDWPSAGAVLMK